MELSIPEKCALIVGSRHIHEVEINEQMKTFRVRWRNDPQTQMSTNCHSDEVFHVVLNDALSYIAYLEQNQMY